MRTTQLAKALFIALVALVMVAGPASAHDPIFIADDQTTADVGPFMPDGTISWALYGQVLGDGDTRGFEFDLRDGDELYISLLIPNLEPELSLADAELPTVELESPDGSVRTLEPEVRIVFDEEFSGTSYVTLIELREPGQDGRYRGTVVGSAPSRFTVAIGEREIFFTETERSGDRPSSFMEVAGPLQAWYSTAPGGEQTELDDGEAEMNMERLEEVMASGEGTMAEGGSIDGTSDDEAGVEAQEPVQADEADEAASTDNASADDSSTEVAAAVGAEDGGGGSGWVAPVVIAVAVVVGAAVFLAGRGRRDSDAVSADQ